MWQPRSFSGITDWCHREHLAKVRTVFCVILESPSQGLKLLPTKSPLWLAVTLVTQSHSQWKNTLHIYVITSLLHNVVTWACQIMGDSIVYWTACLVYITNDETSKMHVNGPLWGEIYRWFPSQRASNAASVSIWHHHDWLSLVSLISDRGKTKAKTKQKQKQKTVQAECMRCNVRCMVGGCTVIESSVSH